MAGKGKRRFGTVRALPSGRWQARYRGPDGQMRPAPQPFLSERDAEQWLSVVESELLRGEWIDPWRSAITLCEFGQQWIKDRKLKPRTRDDYEGIFRNHIEPHLGAMSVGEIDPATVRQWRTTLLIRTLSERDNGHLDPASTPKSPAGVRSAAVPALVMADLTTHLAEFTDPASDAFVFLGELGGRLRRSNFRRATHWRATVRRVGLSADFHFHDLCHTGNQLAAEAGATTKELMRRMGHSTVRAAMRYQHSTDRRDRQIAAEMHHRASTERGEST